MTMTQLGKMVADTTQQFRMPKECGLYSFMNLRPCGIHVIQVAVIVLLSMAYAKATNPCTENQFWVYEKDGSTSCENCPICLPGQGLSPECGKRVLSSAMVTCVPCPPRASFSSKHDTSSCTPCSSCSKDQVVLRNCTSQWDIKCAKRCYSKDRYYDDDKGDCFACSPCCGDDQDVVEDECKGKLGAGSNMICSFHSSVNRCEKSTTPQTPTTIINQSTTANDYISPSQGSTREYTEPPTTPSTRSLHPSQRKDEDLLAAVSIPVVILVLLVCCGCFYFFKKRQDDTSFWCNRDAENGSHDLVTEVQCSLDKKAIEGEAEETLTGNDTFYKLGTISPESREPLLKEGDPLLTCSCEIATEEDSKLLCTLLQQESDDVQKIYNCLDTKMPGHGHYRAVALYYDLDIYQIASCLEKHDEGPTRALIEWLAAGKPELTVKEFVTVVRNEAKRNDVAHLLEKYDADDM